MDVILTARDGDARLRKTSVDFAEAEMPMEARWPCALSPQYRYQRIM